MRKKESPEKEFPVGDAFEGDGGADGGREPAGADDDGTPVGVDGRAGLLEDGDDVHRQVVDAREGRECVGDADDGEGPPEPRAVANLLKSVFPQISLLEGLTSLQEHPSFLINSHRLPGRTQRSSHKAIF